MFQGASGHGWLMVTLRSFNFWVMVRARTSIRTRRGILTCTDRRHACFGLFWSFLCLITASFFCMFTSCCCSDDGPKCSKAETVSTYWCFSKKNDQKCTKKHRDLWESKKNENHSTLRIINQMKDFKGKLFQLVIDITKLKSNFRVSTQLWMKIMSRKEGL